MTMELLERTSWILRWHASCAICSWIAAALVQVEGSRLFHFYSEQDRVENVENNKGRHLVFCLPLGCGWKVWKLVKVDKCAEKWRRVKDELLASQFLSYQVLLYAVNVASYGRQYSCTAILVNTDDKSLEVQTVAYPFQIFLAVLSFNQVSSFSNVGYYDLGDLVNDSVVSYSDIES
ncbi:hypothetical protein BCR41DRAFT_373804 [Lobosporangium transversale]|uniref:Uncharacterized protein n=1 Tax=Lobosporangium transversale TaxID=64571 RepID=A0A1Y2GCI0_9FUNG|nr:hypothetical protein BCR41DRAFT_373804 [Lobosporangium transversale]ORZ07028.1 hypothetical protein BCR41DRAFT_373804 [Lobosporangium transversale]|eukprot:XP_021877824.1 hypothetical protein BCR41DRAFT_373804 [Lobosporangium transversale]